MYTTSSLSFRIFLRDTKSNKFIRFFLRPLNQNLKVARGGGKQNVHRPYTVFTCHIVLYYELFILK